MRIPIDLVGRKFGRLLVIGKSYRVGKTTFAKCLCDCGEERPFRKDMLLNGRIRSCGCSRDWKWKTTHGHTRYARPSSEYRAWRCMKNRCHNPKYEKYYLYGGRGITVCERWLHSFDNFIADMGKKPTPKHTLDRRETDKGYNPENCRWATQIEQQNNKRNSLKVTFNGETLTIAEWSVKFGIVGKSLYKNFHLHGTRDFDDLLNKKNRNICSFVIK